MSDRRNAVFLEEMGVGPQWRLRNRPVSAETYATPSADTAIAIDAAPEPFAAAQHAAVPPAASHVASQAAVPPAAERAAMATAAAQHAAVPPAASHVASQAAAQPAAERAAMVPAAGHAAPAAAAQHASVPPASGHAGPAAAAQHAAAPPPASPARVPGAPSIASTGEDMSWFDDAPTPAFQPQRKKVAPPEQPPAASPQRPAPAPSAPAARPQPAAAARVAPPHAEAPAFDDIPMDEPPSWFDDEQSAAAPAPGAVSDEAIAAMDWPTLQAAVQTCTRCTLCETRQQAIPGRGDENATWIVLDTMPGPEEDSEGYQFAGKPGHLLDNMLKAVGQSTEQGAYLTSLVKCHAERAPSADELQACRPYLERELALTQAKVIVATGHSAGKGLLGAAARGRIMLHGEVPVVATYHPADLLKKPEDKAKAWQDLCLAKAAHAGRR